MSDSSEFTSSDEEAAREIGRAFLSAHRAAAAIVAQAQLKAEALLADSERKVAASVPASGSHFKAWPPEEDVEGLADQLDQIEDQLHHSRSQMLELIEEYLRSAGNGEEPVAPAEASPVAGIETDRPVGTGVETESAIDQPAVPAVAEAPAPAAAEPVVVEAPAPVVAEAPVVDAVPVVAEAAAVDRAPTVDEAPWQPDAVLHPDTDVVGAAEADGLTVAEPPADTVAEEAGEPGIAPASLAWAPPRPSTRVDVPLEAVRVAVATGSHEPIPASEPALPAHRRQGSSLRDRAWFANAIAGVVVLVVLAIALALINLL